MKGDILYQPTRDQRALADAFSEALPELLPIARLHAADHETAATWSALAELGLFAIAAEEAAGGAGLGAIEEALIVIRLGQQLAHPSIFATIGAAHATVGSSLPAHAAAAFRAGEIVAIADPEAEALLLREADGAASLHALSGMGRELDGGIWHAHLAEAGNLGPHLGTFSEEGLVRLRLIDAAALAGLANGALEMAVNYAKLREQFGRPIGSFQAVKHHCANMAMAARLAADQTGFAAAAVDAGRPGAAAQVEAAFAVAAEAALKNAGLNIQIHGGIGFSDEADPHLFLKRARLLIAIAGGTESALARIAETAA